MSCKLKQYFSEVMCLAEISQAWIQSIYASTAVLRNSDVPPYCEKPNHRGLFQNHVVTSLCSYHIVANGRQKHTE
jgi:hypothetical protein